MQAALTLGGGQFVGRLGEVVHADERSRPRSGGGWPVAGSAAWSSPDGSCVDDAALGLERAGQVRVVVDRQAIRRQGQDLLQRAVEADDVLLGQTVDQVDAHRLEAVGARASITSGFRPRSGRD